MSLALFIGLGSPRWNGRIFVPPFYPQDALKCWELPAEFATLCHRACVLYGQPGILL